MIVCRALGYLPGWIALSVLLIWGCDSSTSLEPTPTNQLNLSHLEKLGEDIVADGDTIRIIHIYSEFPDYGWVGDDDEGIACVDDVARAAVVYLRRYELTGAPEAKQTAKKLIRFLLYMQSESGLFYNFVTDNQLTINTAHDNSRADRLNWWTARAVWALGRCAYVLGDDPLAALCAGAVERVFPHIENVLDTYGQFETINGRSYPTWLIYHYASDATSEMMLGLTALAQARPSVKLSMMIGRLAEGIAEMQHGTVTDAPYGAILSWRETWHAWGSSQAQALSGTAQKESTLPGLDTFYGWLLVNGWVQEIQLGEPTTTKEFSQIAYGTRCVVVGLTSLYDRTGDPKWAVMAALAASWFTGNNAAHTPMYDHATGRGYDGLNGPSEINNNAGAESTIEALMAIQEVERLGGVSRWMNATAGAATKAQVDSVLYRYRIFTLDEAPEDSMAVFQNLDNGATSLLSGDELSAFFDKQSQ